MAGREVHEGCLFLLRLGICSADRGRLPPEFTARVQQHASTDTMADKEDGGLASALRQIQVLQAEKREAALQRQIDALVAENRLEKEKREREREQGKKGSKKLLLLYVRTKRKRLKYSMLYEQN